MSSNQIIATCILVFGLIGLAASGFWTYKINQNKRGFEGFEKRKQNEDSIWGFTKRNFPLFLTLFFFILAFAGCMMFFS